MVAKVQPATGGIKEPNSRPRRIGMRDLFKSRCRGIKPLCQVMRLRRQKIGSSQQSRFGMQQTRVIQDRNRLIEMPVFHFKLCKLKKSRCDRRRFDAGASQVGIHLVGAGLRLARISSRARYHRANVRRGSSVCAPISPAHCATVCALRDTTHLILRKEEADPGLPGEDRQIV